MSSERGGAIDLFKIAGVQVAIDYSWLIIFVLVLWSLSTGYFPYLYPGYGGGSYWLVGLAATLSFFASVLIHELSHAAVANRLGERVSRITLFIFGGMAHLSGEPRNAADEMKIAAAGPLTSLALGTIFWAVPKVFALFLAWPLWVAVFRYLAFINVALALFNLLPGFPLDGGRLLRAVLWWRWGDLKRATARAADWGRGIAVGLVAMGVLEILGGALVGGLWLIFIALFLRSAAAAGYQSMLLEQVLSSFHVSDIMVKEPITVNADMSVEDAVEEYFLRLGYSGFPVVRDGRVVGLLSLSHVRNCPVNERSQRLIREIMRPLDKNIEIARSASISEALNQMAESDVGRLLVMDGDRFTGLITRSGVARFVQMRTQLSALDSAPTEAA